jgi:hypothetical protein
MQLDTAIGEFLADLELAGRAPHKGSFRALDCALKWV